jgi:hypothetical protein
MVYGNYEISRTFLFPVVAKDILSLVFSEHGLPVFVFIAAKIPFSHKGFILFFSLRVDIISPHTKGYYIPVKLFRDVWFAADQHRRRLV